MERAVGATAATTAARETSGQCADAARRRIAALVLQERESRSVGEFTLRPVQREAVRDIARAFIQYGGALLADPPGTGKTVIALAVAQRERDVLVAAPATLRDQWLTSAARADVAIRFVSLESLSHGASPPRAPLLIVDEAHHARTPGTHRYTRLARLAMGAQVLLLTATPVVNGIRDRDALLALFLGARARGLAGADLARVIVRRAHAHLPRPTVRPLPPLRHAAEQSGIAEAIRALPPPLPVADGAAATALLRISLAMAWASSLAALDVTLRRRLQRGAALADSLASGRWPGHATLRRWIIGDDATQLAMPLLLDDGGHVPPPDAHEVLTVHLDAVRALRAAVTPRVAFDTATRASALSELAAAHRTRRIVFFAQHASTVAALYRAMRAHAGVVAIVGDRVFAAHGRWTRREVLQAVGPQAPPFTAHDPRGIRILLTTDLLAEGVELQGMGIVVHGDPAWTPSRFTQRVGRAARGGGSEGGGGMSAGTGGSGESGESGERDGSGESGGSGSEVFVTRFPVPFGAASILRLAPRLTRKAAAGVEALSDARAEERIRQRLQRWLAPGAARSAAAPGPREPHKFDAAHGPAAVVVAHTASARDGFIAVLRSATGSTMVVGRRSLRGWRVSSEPRRVLQLVRRAEGPTLPADEQTEHDARRALARWLQQRRAVVSAGLTPALEPRLQRAVQRRLNAAVAAAPLSMRTRVALVASADLAAVLRASGGGVTREIERLCRGAFSPTGFLSALAALAENVASARDQHALPAPAPRLAALLILRAPSGTPEITPRRAPPAESPPDSRARPGAWPGTAAPH